MANEINFGYYTGKTLSYAAYQPDGTVRTAAGTPLPEIAGTGYYVASNASIVAGDFVIVKEGTLEVGQGQYQPEVTASGISSDLSAIEAKIDIIDTNVDTLGTKVDTIDTNVDLIVTDVGSVLTAAARMNNVHDDNQKTVTKVVSLENL